MPWASDGMSMGSVITTAMAPLKRILVRHSTHDITMAQHKDMNVAISEMTMELMHAVANCGDRYLLMKRARESIFTLRLRTTKSAT